MRKKGNAITPKSQSFWVYCETKDEWAEWLQIKSPELLGA